MSLIINKLIELNNLLNCLQFNDNKENKENQESKENQDNTLGNKKRKIDNLEENKIENFEENKININTISFLKINLLKPILNNLMFKCYEIEFSHICLRDSNYANYAVHYCCGLYPSRIKDIDVAVTLEQLNLVATLYRNKIKYGSNSYDVGRWCKVDAVNCNLLLDQIELLKHNNKFFAILTGVNDKIYSFIIMLKV